MFSIKIVFNTIRIYCNDLPYVVLNRNELVGVQAWTDDNDKYSIEFYLKTTSITTQQDSKEKWNELLKLIDKNIFFN